MARLLRSGWFLVLLGALLYGVVTALLLSPGRLRLSRPTQDPADNPAHPRPSWDFFNPEVERLVAELKKEKETLATREKELSALATRLEAERAEITVVTQAVHQLQREMDRNVARVKDDEQANLKKLGKMYATMTADGAAGILKELDDDQIVKILVFMKDDEGAAVLENFSKLGEAEKKRAALITERIRTAQFRSLTKKP